MNIIQGKVLRRKVKKRICVLFVESAVYVDMCNLNCEWIKLRNVYLTHKCASQCQMEGCQEWRKSANFSIFITNKF